MKDEDEVRLILLRHIDFLECTVDPAARMCIEGFINGLRCVIDD